MNTFNQFIQEIKHIDRITPKRNIVNDEYHMMKSLSKATNQRISPRHIVKLFNMFMYGKNGNNIKIFKNKYTITKDFINYLHDDDVYMDFYDTWRDGDNVESVIKQWRLEKYLIKANRGYILGEPDFTLQKGEVDSDRMVSRKL